MAGVGAYKTPLPWGGRLSGCPGEKNYNSLSNLEFPEVAADYGGAEWYARQDSNLWPSAPEADALSI